MAQFSIRQAYKAGFNSLINNIGTLLAPLAIIFVLYALNTRFMTLSMETVGILPRLVFLFATIAVGLLLTIGIERIGFDISYRGSTDWRRLFSGYNLIVPFFLSGLFYGLIVLGGICLLIIPGIIWSIKYSFHDLFIVDTECTARESISRSGELTEGHKWKLFLFSYINYLVGLLSFGLLYPVIIFARISVYRQLKNSRG